jgi:hypothetical protein
LLVQDGDRKPAKTLAERHGGASGTWTNRVAEARKRGLLTAVKSGEAGGGLSDKAIEILTQANDPQRLRNFLQVVADKHGTGAAKISKSVCSPASSTSPLRTAS